MLSKLEIDVLEKLKRYCMYQERCRLELFQKLRNMGYKGEYGEKFIAILEEEGFINEARYALAYSLSKFNQKSWGKYKISLRLKEKGIAQKEAQEALNAIDEELYLARIKELIDREDLRLREVENVYVRRDKLSKKMIAKGFEPNLVWEEIKLRYPL